MDDLIKQLKNTKSKELCLKFVYEILSLKYQGDRLKTVLFLPLLFDNDIEKNWQRSGFLHCTNINKILKYLLLESGHFVKTDIERKWTLIWGVSPHEYLKIKTEEGIKNIDVWAKPYGVSYGDYAHAFNQKIWKRKLL